MLTDRLMPVYYFQLRMPEEVATNDLKLILFGT